MITMMRSGGGRCGHSVSSVELAALDGGSCNRTLSGLHARLSASICDGVDHQRESVRVSGSRWEGPYSPPQHPSGTGCQTKVTGPRRQVLEGQDPWNQAEAAWDWSMDVCTYHP